MTRAANTLMTLAAICVADAGAEAQAAEFAYWTDSRTASIVRELGLALEQLEARFPDDHELVMPRYFTGLTLPEAADVLGRPLRTLQRRWRFARTWLRRELGGSGA